MRFPGKVAMRVVNDRPPCLETPWEYFREELTPVEAFYVRWHLQVIPTVIDTRTWRLKVGGSVNTPLELSLDDIRRMPATSIVAVNQCSGNSRGLSAPPVPGAQWGDGAMGNAKWTGVRLADILDRTGYGKLKVKVSEVSFQGLDRGGAAGVPDYIKTLPIAKARDPNVLLAYAMNDQPLPLLNGFPLRVVVPGWYATYWVKALERIDILTAPHEGFWMKPAYRIPTTPNGNERPDDLAKVTIPINRVNVRSFFTMPTKTVSVNAPVALQGFAFDGGDGIRSVEIDDGTGWKAATLGTDLGGFSFRRWKLEWTPSNVGKLTLRVKATSKSGESQSEVSGWNRSGYMRNVIERVILDVV